jgi:hypothetical protein
MKALLFWTPRLLCLLFAVFISLFALDVFGENLGFWPTVGAFSIHLIPTAIVLVVLAVAWRWELIGGALLILAGLGYTMMVLTGHHPLGWILAIAGPAVLVGGLFLLDWCYRTCVGSSEPVSPSHPQ